MTPDYGDRCQECGGPIDRYAPLRTVACSDTCRETRIRRLATERQRRRRARA